MKRRYNPSMILKILLVHCSSPLSRLIVANTLRKSPKTHFSPIPRFRCPAFCSAALAFLNRSRPRAHPIIWTSSSVRRYPERKQSFCAGGAKHGQSVLGRKNHRRKRRHRRCRRQPVFPARCRQKAIPCHEQPHFHLPLEGHCALLSLGSRRLAQRKRRLVLPCSQSSRRRNQEPHRLLEGRPRRSLKRRRFLTTSLRDLIPKDHAILHHELHMPQLVDVF